MRIIYILIFIAFFSYSCEKEIAYNGEKLENYLVLNAVLEPDSLIKCQVTRSNTMFQNGTIVTIEDAVVELYQNDQLIETLTHSQNGYYQTATLKASIGEKYSFKVSQKQFTNINCNTILPGETAAELTSVKYNGSTGNYDMELLVKDKPGKDCYRILIYTLTNFNGDDNYYQTFIDSNDPVLNYNMVINDESGFSDYPDNNFMIFNDDLFEGEDYRLKFSIYGYENAPVKVVLQHITEDLYQYYHTVQARDYYHEDPFTEPVRIYSNVDGGAGILGGATSTVSLHSLPENNL